MGFAARNAKLIALLLFLCLSYAVIILTIQSSLGSPLLRRTTGGDNPTFEFISSNWTQKPYKIRMDDMWQSEGINATGQNYYFFPKPAKGHRYSERFNPQSDYFQSWFGAYTIEDTNDKTYALSGDSIDPQAILDLAIADQKGWLRSFGLPEPLVAVDTSIPVNVTEIQIDGGSGWKITGKINANVDVGADNPWWVLPALLSAPTRAWHGLVESYGSASLDVVSYVWYTPENKELNVVYYNGIEFNDLGHSHHRTLPLIETELDAMVQSVTVRK